MSNQQAMIELIKATSGQANILTIPRPYIEFMGSLDGGLFLSQLIYWSDRGGQGDGWFYKTYLEWEAETTLSKYEIGKQAGILKDKGILETKVKKANGAPTVHYHFSFSEFQKSFVKFLYYRKSKNLTMESEETSQSITETTPETTPETKASSAPADYSRPISRLTLEEIKALKLPLASWQQHLTDEQAERNRAGVIKFLKAKITIGPLLPDTEAAHSLFDKLAIEAEAKGRRPPDKFPTLAVKEKFNIAATNLNGTLESAIDKALESGITAIPRIVNYISSPKCRNNDGRQKSTQTRQRETSGKARRTTDNDFAPPAGSGQTPEMARKLRAAFAPRP